MDKILKLRIEVWAVVVFGVAVALLWFLVPVPKGLDHQTFYSPFGVPTTLVDLTIAIGSGVLFLQAWRNFKQELKPAYRFIAAAQLVVGITTLIYPYIEYYDLWENTWFNMSSYVGYLFGSVLMYFGARQFMKILGIRGRLTTPLLMLGYFLALSVIHAFLPHNQVWPAFTEHQYDLFEMAVVAPVLFYAIAAYGMGRISRRIGSDYRKAFGWLAGGLALQLVSAFGLLIMDMVGYDNWYFNTRLYELPTICADILILTAAYSFNTVGLASTGQSIWRRLFSHRTAQPVTSLDIISYTAGMVSNPKNIDPALDKVRLLSAKLKPGEAPSAEDQAALRGVYLEIEKYLVTAEPLRTITRDDVRNRVIVHFGLDHAPTDKTFWPAVGTA